MKCYVGIASITNNGTDNTLGLLYLLMEHDGRNSRSFNFDFTFSLSIARRVAMDPRRVALALIILFMTCIDAYHGTMKSYTPGTYQGHITRSTLKEEI